MTRRLLAFLAWPVAVGLIAAAALLIMFPQLLNPGNQRIASPLDNLAPGTRTPWGQTTSYAQAVRKAAPSVVNIYTRKRLATRRHPLLDDPYFRRLFNQDNPQRQQRMQSSLGSGVIITKDGFILTNHHVVDSADEIIVLMYDGRETQATVVGVDKDTDLAVLKIELDNLRPITFGNAAQAEVGDVVLAIGNPFGVGQSVSQGIVSATGRNSLHLNTFDNFIQTDAAINPGNSGGALIDAYGNLLGINAAILNETSSVGIGFAIPADTAVKVLDDIVEHGRVIRGWLGVQAQQLSPELAARLGLNPPAGIIITDVHASGPARAAGLQGGDVVTHINNQRITDGSQGLNLIAGLKPGDPIRLQVVRAGQPLTINATAGTRPPIN